MKEKMGDLQRLHHINKCISDLEEIMKGVDPDSFYQNNEKRYAVERILEIIGEAINRVSKETLEKSHQPIPWRDIVDFRNLITHEYFRVDNTMIYKLATEEILTLKSAIQYLIEKLQE